MVPESIKTGFSATPDAEIPREIEELQQRITTIMMVLMKRALMTAATFVAHSGGTMVGPVDIANGIKFEATTFFDSEGLEEETEQMSEYIFGDHGEEEDSTEESEDDDSFDPGYQSNLYLACSNSKMTAKTVVSIIEAEPEMVKRVYKFDGCLPLHRLCQNSKLEEQSAIDILNLLVSAYPESVKQRIAPIIDWEIIGIKGEFPVNMADEYGMPFGFCKALLAERARQSSMPGCSILQTACVNQVSLKLIKDLVNDDCELLTMKDDDGHVALHTAVNHTSLDVVKYLVEQRYMSYKRYKE